MQSNQVSGSESTCSRENSSSRAYSLREKRPRCRAWSFVTPLAALRCCVRLCTPRTRAWMHIAAASCAGVASLLGIRMETLVS